MLSPLPPLFYMGAPKIAVFPRAYLILELEISSSRCIRCRSPPSFSLRFSLTTARKGFLASNGLEGKKAPLGYSPAGSQYCFHLGTFPLSPEQGPTIRAQGHPGSCFKTPQHTTYAAAAHT